MTIKQLAFDTQKHLQATTGATFKRAHIYELLAAALGFNSYAALSADSVFTQRSITCQHADRHGEQVGQRCLDLDYPPETALRVSHALTDYLTEQEIGVISIPDLVVNLRDKTGRTPDTYGEAESDEESWDDEVFDGSSSDDNAEAFEQKFDLVSEFSPILLEGLTAAAEKGNPSAHYALALLHAPSGNPYDEPSAGSGYWYNEERIGHVLAGVEKEWADEYAAMLSRAEKYEHHLRAAGALGHEAALLELAEHFDDPAFFERSTTTSPDIDPAHAAEIAEHLGRHKDAWRWSTEAAKRGDIAAMRELIEGYDRLNLQQCWTWFYLAELLGTDLVKDEYRAINEDGSPYDDDVGGPVYVGGQGGVELELIDTEQDAGARRDAAALYQAICNRPRLT